MFTYFGYGSNLDHIAMRAKGIVPLRSRVGELEGWRLRFNVAHFFRLEGGVANIEYTGRSEDRVLGVLHDCSDDALVLLDRAELYPEGYDRLTVAPIARQGADAGERVDSVTYVGMPAFVDDSCRPSQRYLNIVVRGATAAGLDPDYIDRITATPVHVTAFSGPFVPPPGDWPTYDVDDLARLPVLTGLAGHVFDMSRARPEHRLVREWFGGRDVTVTIAHRSDASEATETIADIIGGRIDDRVRRYLDTYLSAFADEYTYAGSLRYGNSS